MWRVAGRMLRSADSWVVSYRRYRTTYRFHLEGLPTFRDNLLVPSCRITDVLVQPCSCPSTLLNIPQRRRSHLDRGGSPKSGRGSSITLLWQTSEVAHACSPVHRRKRATLIIGICCLSAPWLRVYCYHESQWVRERAAPPDTSSVRTKSLWIALNPDMFVCMLWTAYRVHTAGNLSLSCNFSVRIL
jgi:hypothetical protein